MTHILKTFREHVFYATYEKPIFLPGQVSKTDPSPKREMPTMILFSVVFALRVGNGFELNHLDVTLY